MGAEDASGFYNHNASTTPTREALELCNKVSSHLVLSVWTLQVEVDTGVESYH